MKNNLNATIFDLVNENGNSSYKFSADNHHRHEQLTSLIESSLLLASEQDHEKILRHLLMAGKRICNADAATLFLNTPNQTLRFAMRTRDDVLPTIELPLFDSESGKPNEQFVSTYVSHNNRSVVIDDVYEEEGFDLRGTQSFDANTGYRTVSMMTIPLTPRDGDPIGVLQLINAMDEDGEITSFSEMDRQYVEALASQAAVAINIRGLLASQDNLIESIVRVLAGAIDAKSAHTAGHCARVPELAMMLAEEACMSDAEPFSNFRFKNEEEWREFRIGAWLHDCGKITTPEYIVEKATKLETVNNRIHEIRMRFEVLRRDAEIASLKEKIAGRPQELVDAKLSANITKLEDDFAFIAQCNIGGEKMSPEAVERLDQLATTVWMRHFDDGIGLSNEELAHRVEVKVDLPVQEQLLADKYHHRISRRPSRSFDPKYRFDIKVPKDLYNHGELYNLKIARGTLTAEDRYKINEHIMETIVMLEELPFPKNLSRVAEYAGTHHEKMDGTGYPRKLNGEQLSIPARIMVIADIFEALTASDRPYKDAKTLSESIAILADMKEKNHIDADLFDLFLTSELHVKFGKRFLKPEQVDYVNINQYINNRK